jgi:hypothetical protein
MIYLIWFKRIIKWRDVEWYNLNGFEIAIHEDDGDVYFVYQHMVCTFTCINYKTYTSLYGTLDLIMKEMKLK